MTGDERQSRTRGLSAWTTRRWLRVGVAASLVVLAVLGAAGAYVLGRTETLSSNLVDVRSPALTVSIRLEAAVLNQETGIRGYGLTGTKAFLTPYEEGVTEQETNRKQLAGLLRGDAARLKDLKTVQDAVTRWQERIARPVAAEAGRFALTAGHRTGRGGQGDLRRRTRRPERPAGAAARGPCPCQGRPDVHDGPAQLGVQRHRRAHRPPHGVDLRRAAARHQQAPGAARRGRPCRRGR